MAQLTVIEGIDIIMIQQAFHALKPNNNKYHGKKKR